MDFNALDKLGRDAIDELAQKVVKALNSGEPVFPNVSHRLTWGEFRGQAQNGEQWSWGHYEFAIPEGAREILKQEYDASEQLTMWLATDDGSDFDFEEDGAVCFDQLAEDVTKVVFERVRDIAENEELPGWGGDDEEEDDGGEEEDGVEENDEAGDV